MNLTSARTTFVYDAVGNVLQKWHQGSDPITMAYDAAQRLVTSMDGPTLVTFTYDASGNLTNENRGGVQTSYSYDNENRLAVQTDPDGSKTTMTYQPDGLRRSRRTPSVLTTFVWDGADYLQERS